jgi:two-component system chemotaxis response regulator CheB
MRVVVIGCSAGGLDALSRILAPLPRTFPAAIVVVQHLLRDAASQLASILSLRTALCVKETQDGDILRPGAVYIAPPNFHVLVGVDGALALSSAPPVRHSRPSADPLFESAAANLGPLVIAVVLTGGDGDGSVGIVAVKKAGGTVLAQDVASSSNSSMPRSAVATGVVDQVLPLDEIAAALTTLTAA